MFLKLRYPRLTFWFTTTLGFAVMSNQFSIKTHDIKPNVIDLMFIEWWQYEVRAFTIITLVHKIFHDLLVSRFGWSKLVPIKLDMLRTLITRETVKSQHLIKSVLLYTFIFIHGVVFIFHFYEIFFVRGFLIWKVN